MGGEGGLTFGRGGGGGSAGLGDCYRWGGMSRFLAGGGDSSPI